MLLYSLLSTIALAHPDLPGVDSWCITGQTWEPVRVQRPVGPPPPDGQLQERDPFGLPGVELSERFALRFGHERFVSPEARRRLLDAFETAWMVQIEEWGHTPPAGTESHLFNVYIGDTGNGAPEGFGAGGYYSVDPDGWPMIVVAANTLENPSFADITAVHEFYHAVQGSTGRFTYDVSGPGAWFWEATATWSSAAVYPDNDYAHVFLFGYALFPQNPLNFFRYPRTGAFEEFYQYGAFIWPLFVHQQVGSEAPLVEAWEVPDVGGNDPIEALRAALAARGVDHDELWLEHIARNTTWDYPSGDRYRRHVAAYAGAPEFANLVAADLPRQGFDGAREVPTLRRPHRYGSARLSMFGPLEGTYTFTLRGSSEGSFGSDAHWGGTLVLERVSGDPDYVPIPFEGPLAVVEISELERYSRVNLVVGAWSPELSPFWHTETYPLRYWVEHEPVPDPVADAEEPEVTAGCGCAATASSGSSALWGLVPLLLVLRRRTPEGRRQNQ